MKFIILMATIIISSISLQAQPQFQPQPRVISGPESANLLSIQIELMIRELELPSEKQSEFKNIYTQYSDDMSKIMVRAARSTEKSSDEEVEAQIFESFENAEQTTALKREYYTKFKEVLTPYQILQMYGMEREFHERIIQERQRRMGGNSMPQQISPR